MLQKVPSKWGKNAMKQELNRAAAARQQYNTFER
jgi:hypothetical protein